MSTKKVIYWKSCKHKKRVASHFGHKITPQRQHFLRDINITYEICGTE
jgi:DNA polymerase-3 subunit epsilon